MLSDWCPAFPNGHEITQKIGPIQDRRWETHNNCVWKNLSCLTECHTSPLLFFFSQSPSSISEPKGGTAHDSYSVRRGQITARVQYWTRFWPDNFVVVIRVWRISPWQTCPNPVKDHFFLSPIWCVWIDDPRESMKAPGFLEGRIESFEKSGFKIPGIVAM